MSSLAAGRAEIRAALDAVDGVKSYDKQPAAPRQGDAWLRWRGDRADEGVGFDVTWIIVITTPQGEAAADAWIDDHLDDLLAALRPATYVTGYGPANLGTDASPIDGLLITSNRE
jgi:hypothetical protein